MSYCPSEHLLASPDNDAQRRREATPSEGPLPLDAAREKPQLGLARPIVPTTAPCTVTPS
jgi:hypothetical protein